jgi:hypothetical protein
MVAGVGRGRADAEDDNSLALLATLRLALEDYRSVCGWYPEELTVDADTSGLCEFPFGNFLPPHFDLHEGEFPIFYPYAPLRSISTGGIYCGAYHIAVELNPESKYFSEDEDLLTNALSKWVGCDGGGIQYAPIDGRYDENDYLYDLLSSKGVQ